LIKKVKAYTLSEIIVVLLLTSIVAGIAFSVLNLVQKHMYSIQGNFKNKAVLRNLEQSLTIDFNTYPNVKYSLDKAQLTCFSEIDSVTYTFTSDSVLKDIDTFHIAIGKKTFFFIGNEVSEGGVDAIKIDSIAEIPSHKMFVFKYNDANTFIK